MKFSAPKLPGHYVYSVILRSDSYFDVDVMENLAVSCLFTQNFPDRSVLALTFSSMFKQLRRWTTIILNGILVKKKERTIIKLTMKNLPRKVIVIKNRCSSSRHRRCSCCCCYCSHLFLFSIEKEKRNYLLHWNLLFFFSSIKNTNKQTNDKTCHYDHCRKRARERKNRLWNVADGILESTTSSIYYMSSAYNIEG